MWSEDLGLVREWETDNYLMYTSVWSIYCFMVLFLLQSILII